ncbi:maleylpyruvate isomerase N-terminal domain-containing protein [Actinoplanes sp. DH11]|uniref:maleylpyruvate isomerase N-terminal domain-containing protein n=1 Tax=Actinoplanes sp. DH11 TaxID=2857011 RepID=UPI001E51E8E6|nr:maleylpyruvate isomerase N-terminal domain-containing protein [Actinoplanes sp. DH11]
MDYRRTYRSAAIAFTDLVSRIPPDRLDGPGLGDWTLRDLLGHTVSSALRQVPDVLAQRAPMLVVPGPEWYFAAARTAPEAVVRAARAASADDARSTGKALGDRPADAVGAFVGRATGALAAATDDDLVATPAGGMRVADWLPTRTFELVVHGSDAAVAAGVPITFDQDTLTEAAALAARTAVAVGDGPAALRALTGRGPLPPGFSVV